MVSRHRVTLRKRGEKCHDRIRSAFGLARTGHKNAGDFYLGNFELFKEKKMFVVSVTVSAVFAIEVKHLRWLSSLETKLVDKKTSRRSSNSVRNIRSRGRGHPVRKTATPAVLYLGGSSVQSRNNGASIQQKQQHQQRQRKFKCLLNSSFLATAPLLHSRACPSFTLRRHLPVSPYNIAGIIKCDVTLQ